LTFILVSKSSDLFQFRKLKAYLIGGGQKQAKYDFEKTVPDADNCLGRVLFVGPDQLLFSMIESYLTEQFEYESVYVSSGKALISKEIRDASDICFISAAALGDSSDVVSYCMALRQSKPDLPTILCSAEVSMSDYSTERWEICDATLRIPLTRVATLLGVSAALENNAGFVKKCINTGRWRDPDELMASAPSEIADVLVEDLARGEA
jgi:hypothetical protein